MKRPSQLGLELDGISSELHRSFTADGTLVGQYGRLARCQQSNAEVRSPEAVVDTGSMPPVRCHRSGRCAQGVKRGKANFLIPRQRLRERLAASLEPDTVQYVYKAGMGPHG